MGLCGSAPKETPDYRDTSGPQRPFTVEKLLGEGVSCKVSLIRDARGVLYAQKTIKNDKEGQFKKMWETEVRILQKISHPNILEYVSSYEEGGLFHIITVYCQGGELFDRVAQGNFSEKVASRLAKQMLKAVAYCHSKGVVHRDLKPENFVFESASIDSNMRLIDFGCAKEVHDDEIVHDYAGSPYYVAPEVLRDCQRTGKMWKASDMWSIGVIIFLLVTGYPPFNGHDHHQIFARIRRGHYSFPHPQDIPLSDSVKDLISKLLVMEPSKRLTAEEALKHPWIAGDTASAAPLPDTVIRNLANFQSHCKLQKAVARALAQRMTDDDKQRLIELFRRFDKNGDGQLGPDEIAAMMKEIGGGMDVKEFLSRVDEDNSGTISLDEFTMAAAVGHLSSANEEELKRTFDAFDVDRDGFVTMKEVEKLCGNMSPEEARRLIAEVDKNGDGKISFDEWIAAMQAKPPVG